MYFFKSFTVFLVPTHVRRKVGQYVRLINSLSTAPIIYIFYYSLFGFLTIVLFSSSFKAFNCALFFCPFGFFLFFN